MTTKAKSSTLEKASVLAAILILVAIAVYLVSYYFKHSNLQAEPAYAANIPASGNVARIQSITTGWVKREADDTIYPVGTITLDPSLSQSGSLRVFFMKDVGVGLADAKTIGDSDTFEVTHGLFANGTNSLTVTCTKGLPSMSDFFGYCAQEETRWTLEVLEPKAGSSEFVKFARAPIDTVLLKETQ